MARKRPFTPMKASSSETPPVGDDWGYEIKWDGMRIIASLDADGVRLSSSNGKDATNSFPELAALDEVLDGFDSLVLDGEVVAIDEFGIPNFVRLQQRMHVTDRNDALRRASSVPVSYAIFDILSLNGNDTMGLAFRDRRSLLEEIVFDGSHWRLTELHLSDPDPLIATVMDLGLEGIMAKQLSSIYQPGKRPASWVKVKPRMRQEFIVGGWSEGKDGNSGSLGSLLLGVMVDGELVHCGSVGSGLNAESRREWHDELLASALPDKPFGNEVPTTAGRKFHWAEPIAVIEVAFHDWAQGGHLRHPVYLGRRVDKDPFEVVRESPTRRG